MSNAAQATNPNRVLSTWRMMSAQIENEGKSQPAFGSHPNGMLSFTPDMHYVEVLTHGDAPRFASDELGEGTDAENRAAASGSLGFFGTYTIDANGEFLGNNVQGSTFRTGSATFVRARSFASSSTATAWSRISSSPGAPRSSSIGSACADWREDYDDGCASNSRDEA